MNALYRNAWGTFTIAMTIPIGFIMGFYLQKFRPGQVAEVSLLGVVLLVAAVIFGRVVAQSSVAGWFELERTTLVWGLAGYGFLASVLPGWMLLVPRGYLSTFMKLGVVASAGGGSDSHGADDRDAAHHDICERGRTDYSRYTVSLSLYHHCLRSRVGLSLAGLFRDDAEDDRAGVPGYGRLWGDAIGKFCRCDGVDCGLGVDPRGLSGDQYDALAGCAGCDGLSRLA